MWKQEMVVHNRVEGKYQGKTTLQLRRRLGPVRAAYLDTLTLEQLDDLGEALLDFTLPADLEEWLARH